MKVTEPEIVELEPQPTLIVRGHVPIAGLPTFFATAFTAVMERLDALGMAPVGPPFGFYPSTPGEIIDVRAGFPVATTVESAGPVEAFSLPGGPAVTTTHLGSYDTLEQTYDELRAWVIANDRVPGATLWEQYLTDPAVVPPEQWRTVIIWPFG